MIFSNIEQIELQSKINNKQQPNYIGYVVNM